MTSPLPDSLLDEVNGLAFACLNGEAGPEDIEHLNELLFNSEPARRIYAHTICDSLILRQWAAATELHSGEMFDGGDSDAAFLRLAIADADLIATASSSNICGDEPRNAAPVAVFPVLSYFGTAYHGTIGFFSQELPFSLLIATVLTSLGLWIASLVHISVSEQIAKNSSQRVRSASDRTLERVGKITGMLNCKWADPQTETSHGSNVLLGRRYSLASGLMEITYNTGAKVILQGPVTYEVESNGGYLSLGKLTGKLENKAEDSNLQSLIPNPSLSAIHYPLFTIRTSTATVTDLGTEFGVEVDQAGVTTSHVFRGTVRVQMVSAEGTAEGEGQVLHANQSARIEKIVTNREGVGRVTVFKTPSTQDTFAREVPAPKLKTFDLVDVVAGGDGFSGRRNAGIDPTTGRRSNVVEFGNNPKVVRIWPKGDGKYHKVEELPFVDGVFVPDGSKGPLQVDSVGHTFVECPKTANQTPHHIWAGGRIPATRASIATKLDGIDYASQGHGVLSMHANNGITFDLNTIRKGNLDWTIKRFHAVAGNVEQGNGGSLADIWVLVDGKVRYRRNQINSYHGGFSFSIPIHDGDRFLTLVTTDGGNGMIGDFMIFGDPQLELIEANNGQTSKYSTEKGGR